MKEALFWIFIAIFSITAIITLLGITGVIKTIKENYLNALFTALILEVVVAVVLLFRNADFLAGPADNGPCLEDVIKRSQLTAQASQAANPSDFLVDLLRQLPELEQAKDEAEQLSGQIATKTRKIDALQAENQALEAELQKLNQQFFTKITRLRNYISQYGGFINLAWRAREKEAVYRLLIEIFGDMGLIRDEAGLYLEGDRQRLNYKAVQDIYKAYRASLQMPVEEDTRIYIREYDSILFIRTYLKQTSG